MPVIEIESIKELRDMVGKEIAVSDWFEVTQERINQFSETTEDRQWIHTDIERARTESPYGTTIAHGFLTLSLIGTLLGQALRIRRRPRMGINYGLNRVRFPAAVPSGSHIRGRFSVESIEDLPDDGVQITWRAVIECDAADKPCCVAEWITRRYE